MAKNPYPKIPAKAWATLRSKAVAAPSTRFTPSAVAALLGMASASSAQTNVVSAIQRFGLIDDSGALTARGNNWRVDSTYGKACQEILDDVYPDDLATLTDENGTPDPLPVKTWFDHQGFGNSNAQQMAATYIMIASKSIPELVRDGKTTRVTKKAAVKASPNRRVSVKQPEQKREKIGDEEVEYRKPSVHLDLQIHLPAAATAEQIDLIFASMAKHLYGR